MLPRSLPRWRKDTELLHGDLNALASAAEKANAWKVDGGSGLLLTDTGTGYLLSLQAPDVVAAIRLAGQLPAGDGAVICGQGAGAVLDFDPTTGTFKVDQANAQVVVFNLINVAIAAGSTILAGWAYGQWFYLLTICANADTSATSG